MKYFSLFLLASVLFLAWGCSSLSVKYDYDPGTDFSAFKTFSLDDKMIKKDALTRNPLVKRRVYNALEKVLSEKGYIKKEGKNVDFIVVAHAGIKERVQIERWGDYGWYRPGWGRHGHTDVTYYNEANLIIDIIDRGRKELAWRGVATDVVKEYSSAEAAQEGINKTVAKVLENFPPPE